MKAIVEWKGGLAFTGMGSSGIPILIDSHLSTDGKSMGVRPMEMIIIGLVSCMAMDVISILEKKREVITSYQVSVDAPRSPEYPKVFTSALVTFVVSGRSVKEIAVRRAIELAVTKYCAAYVMLEKVFPITASYEIFEVEGDNHRRLLHQGVWQNTMQE